MQYRQLGHSDLEVSTIAFGAWQIGDPDYWGPDPTADAQSAVNAALDAGINFFDTAEGYGDGESERILGQCLGPRRKDVYIASKVFPQNCGAAQLRASCEASLQRLGTDYIDLYQIHWPPRDVMFEEVFMTLADLQQEGKIRFVGVSNYGPQDLDAWFRGGSAESNQVGYNLLFRAPEYQIVPACRNYGVGVIAYSPLMQGLLAGRWDNIDDIPLVRRRFRHFSSLRSGTRHGEPGHESLLMDTITEFKALCEIMQIPMATVALSWLLSQPGVTSAIVGSRKPDQIAANARAADLVLGPAAIHELNRISGELKMAMGPNADLWEGEPASRIQ